MGIFRSKEKARRGLIQAVRQHEGETALGISSLEPLFDIGQRSVLGGDAQHTRRLVDHDDVAVLVNQGRGGIAGRWAFLCFDVALCHVGQERAALLNATGVELPMGATIALGAASIPEFGQSNRFELVLQGILQ